MIGQILITPMRLPLKVQDCMIKTQMKDRSQGKESITHPKGVRAA